MSERDRDTMNDEMLTKLLSLADEGPAVPRAGMQRTHDAARSVWTDLVRRRRRRRTAFTIAVASAAVLLLIVVGFVLNRPASHVASTVAIIEAVSGEVRLESSAGEPIRLLEGAEIVDSSRITSGSTGRAALRLTNGHGVRIDHDTSVRLDAANSLDLRLGALYVDSGSTHSGGVRIKTPRGDATDIGTSFEVRYEAERMQVIVRSGVVRVDLPSEKLRVESGRGVVISDTQKTWLDVPAHAKEWEWAQSIAPPFEIDGRTVEAFLRWYERETGRNVRFADPGVAEIARKTTLHGTTIEAAPDRAVAGVLMSAGLDGETSDGEITIRSIDPGMGLTADD